MAHLALHTLHTPQEAAAWLRSRVQGVLHTDSRRVQAGDGFIAWPGGVTDGRQFAASALKQGATACLVEQSGVDAFAWQPNEAMATYEGLKAASGPIAAAYYEQPSQALDVVAITGTNGKTSVTQWLTQALDEPNHRTAVLGTLGAGFPGALIQTGYTTPDAPRLQTQLKELLDAGAQQVAIEISSHALDQERIVGLDVRTAVFTNLTQDHLDYHKNMDSYFAAKAKLFTHEYAESGFINIDNSYGARLFAQSQINSTSLSRTNKNATWHFTEINPITSGVEFTMRGRDGILIESRTPMHGGFNLDNLLMAVAIAYECGIDPLEIATIIPTMNGAPGRLESVALGQNFTALVDYAHSPDAVINVLQAVREFTTGRVIAVLGCGGDRDASKRPLMGSALSSNSDVSIYTSDNPRSENPATILQEMVGSTLVNQPSAVIADRAEAIAYAVSLAAAGDTVIILGKGHESGQEVAGVVTPFDDRIQLAEAIEAKK